MADKEVKIKFTAAATELNNELKKVSSNIKTLNSELKLNSTQLKGNSGDTELLKQRQALLASQLEQSRSKIELTNQKLEKAKEIFGADSQEVAKYKRELIAAKNQEESIKNSIEQCNIKLEQNGEAAKEAESATRQLTGEIEKEEKQLQNLKSEYVDVILNEGKNSDSAEKLKAQISELNLELGENKNKLSEAQQSADELTSAIKENGEAAQTTSNGGFTVMKGVLSNLISNGIQKATQGLKDFAGSVIETGSGFDASMSQVAAVSGATGEELVLLRDKAKEMGATTKFTATESADAMNYMAMAGWKTNDMLDGISGIMNLAAASGEDLATTSDIVTDALTAFGMKAEESGHFADIMATASANANTNVSMMGESFKYVAPVAGALGYSAEDTSVAIGLMANAGIKASQGGTALRTILTNLSKPTDDVSAAMEKMGISLDDGNGNMKSLHDLMVDLRGAFGDMKIPVEDYVEKMAGLDEDLANGVITQKKYNELVEETTKEAYGAEGALQAEAAATIAGKEGMSGLLAIVNSSDEDFNKLTDAVNNATDAETGYSEASEMASEMQDNLSGDITLMQSGLDGLKQHIFDDLNEPMREAVQTVTGDLIPAAINAYDNIKSGISWLKEHKTAVEGVVIGIGALTVGIAAYNVVTGIKAAMEAAETTSLIGLAKAQLASNAAFLASPITWIVAGIVGLVAGFVLLYNKCEGFRNICNGLWDGLTNGISAAVDGVKGAVKGIGDYAGSIKDTFNDAGGGIKGAAAACMKIAKDEFKLGYNALNKLTGGKLGEVVDTASEKFSGIKEKASGCLASIKDTFESNGGGIKGAAAVYMSGVKGVFDTGYDAINKLTGGKLGKIKNVASEKFGALKNVANEKFGALKNVANNKLIDVENTFKSHGGGIKGVAAVYMSGVKGVFNTGYDAINKLTGGKLDGLKNKVSEKLKGVSSKFKGAIDKIKNLFDFHIKWPHIKSPSITVTYDSSGTLAKAAQLLGYPGMPKFGIKWNAEGAILTKATIFGFANGMLQGAGEMGGKGEAVVPIDKLEDYIGNKMAEFVSLIPQIDYDRLGRAVANAVGQRPISIAANRREIARLNV